MGHTEMTFFYNCPCIMRYLLVSLDVPVVYAQTRGMDSLQRKLFKACQRVYCLEGVTIPEFDQELDVRHSFHPLLTLVCMLYPPGAPCYAATMYGRCCLRNCSQYHLPAGPAGHVFN